MAKALDQVVYLDFVCLNQHSTVKKDYSRVGGGAGAGSTGQQRGVAVAGQCLGNGDGATALQGGGRGSGAIMLSGLAPGLAPRRCWAAPRPTQ